jgi:hypothetical protein
MRAKNVLFIVGGLILGLLGWVLWLTTESPLKADDPDTSNDNIVLLEDEEYGVRFTTTEKCEDYLRIGVDDEKYGGLRAYSVSIIGVEEWPDGVWYNYYVYTPEQYNQWDIAQNPIRPATLLTLDSGNLLTWLHPQEGPGNFDCGVKSVKI